VIFLKDDSMITGFAPIASPDAEILILGSIPSIKSLEQNQYYGHPRNAFWSIMGELFCFDKNLEYEKRTELLIKNKIALWDVLKGCERKGSLDSAIKTESVITNDFQKFFAYHQSIKKVFFNGTKAESEFKKRVLPAISKEYQNMQYMRIPSTSPAMASLSKSAKLAEWNIVLRHG
jgi:double-stranded uracil-DNA glycosylase